MGAHLLEGMELRPELFGRALLCLPAECGLSSSASTPVLATEFPVAEELSVSGNGLGTCLS